LESANGELVITGTSLDEYQTEIVACETPLEPIAVNLRHLTMAIGSGEETTLEIKRGRLEIKPTGVTLAITPAYDFDVAISGFTSPKSEDKLIEVAVNVPDALELVRSVAWASFTGQGRENISRVNLVGTAKSLMAQATSGHALAWAERAIISGDFEINIENDYCPNFCEALARKGATLAQNSRWLSVAHESGAYMCKKSEFMYPNTVGLKSAPGEIKLGEIEWLGLKETLQRIVGLCSDQYTPATRFIFSDDCLRIKFSDGSQAGTLDTTLAGQFNSLTIALDAGKVLKALSNLNSPKIEAWCIDELSPVKFRAGDVSIAMCVMRLPAEE
jgi:DNA polymerase III sliding clamp (beta) subunit (PCNA family)